MKLKTDSKRNWLAWYLVFAWNFGIAVYLVNIVFTVRVMMLAPTLNFLLLPAVIASIFFVCFFALLDLYVWKRGVVAVLRTVTKVKNIVNEQNTRGD